MMRYTSILFLLLIGGCAASAQTTHAYVNVNALVRQHPLYGTLAQYDRQIAALEATLHTRFANADARIANAQAAVRHDAQADAAAYRHAVAGSQGCCNVPSVATGNTTPSDIEQHISANYQQQHAQVQTAAQRDMDAYRAALSTEQRRAYDAFIDSMNDRMQMAVNQREQELHEQESNLLLELARKNAPARLMLRAKLQTLVLHDDVRRRLQAQLQALQSQESTALAAARRRDTATLQAYANQVRAQAETSIAQMRSDLQQRSAGNLAARERVMAAQQASVSSLPLGSFTQPSGKPVNVGAQIAAVRSAALPSDAAFGAAGADITTQWNGLRSANRDDTTHTQSQIAWLRHDQEAVRKKIVAQILYEAERIAKSRGYGGVSTQPIPGAPDVTQDVSAGLRLLSSY